MTDSAPDKFSLPCEIGDMPEGPTPGASLEEEGDVPGTPTESWQARGLVHPAGRGWEPVSGRCDFDGDSERGGVPLHHPADGSPPLEGEDEPRSVFGRARQVEFLRALAACGVARRAAALVGVSYRTAYRERRASRGFRLAWDAARISARALSEDVLATRALDGVEVPVWFRGEEVGTRRQYDTRLLLAHLGRLDRLTEDARTRAFADDYEGALERFAEGCDDPAPVCEACGAGIGAPPEGEAGADQEAPIVPSGLCDKCDIPPSSSAAVGRTKTPSRRAEEAATRSPNSLSGSAAPDLASLREDALRTIPCDCPGAEHGTDGGRTHWRMGAHGPEPVANVDGRGPCCDAPSWPACRDCPHYPPVSRVLDEMEEARPADAPALDLLGPLDEVEECQLDAFLADDPEWWRVGAMHQRYCRGRDGAWYPADAPEMPDAPRSDDDSEEEPEPQKAACATG